MYPEFAKEAEEEGNKEAAILFRQIAKVEAEHRDRYKKLLEMVENGTVYKRDEPIRGSAPSAATSTRAPSRRRSAPLQAPHGVLRAGVDGVLAERLQGRRPEAQHAV